MKLRLPSQLYSLLISASVSLTLTAGVSSAKDGFSINFSKGDNGKLSGADLAGVIPTKADNWTNISAPSETPTNLKSNEGTLLTGLSVLSTSANHHFGSGATGGNGTLLTGFIDDWFGAYTVTIEGSPYLVSTVYLIMAGDGQNSSGDNGKQFTAMSVNGVNYTGSGTTTSVGTGVWGDRTPGQSSLAEGTNYLKVNDIVGSQIVIQNIVTAGGRGTIAGIQVVDGYKGTKHDLNLTANGTWKAGVSPVAGAPAWVDSTATDGTYASITSTATGGSTLTISDSVTTDAVVLTNASTSDLTISEGSLKLTGLGTLRVDSADRTLTIKSALSGDQVSGDILHKAGAGTINLEGTVNYTGTFKSEAGTTNFKSETTLTSLQVIAGTTNVMAKATLGSCLASGGTTNFHSEVTLEKLYIGNATVNLESGTTSVTQLRLTEGAGGSVLNVNAGSTLNVTGTNYNHNENDSFILGHTPGKSKFNVTGGTVNAHNTIMVTAWRGVSVTQVSGGALNVKGICYWGIDNFQYGSVFLGTNANGTESNEEATGRINIGSAGISVLRDANTRLILGRGTIGALADWATDTNNGGQKITVLSKLGTIFDTSNVTDPKSGHTITLNHSLTGTGKIIKTGEGTLVLNATDKTTLSDFSGGTEINGGTLKANHAQALGTGDVTINGGTLDATNKYLGNKMTIKGGKISNFAKSGNTLKEVRLLATNKDTNKTITIDNSFLQATTKGSVNIGLGNQLIMMGGSTVTLGKTGQSDVATIALGNINLTNGTNQAAMTVTSGDTLTLAGTWTLDLSGFTGATEKTDYVFHIVSLTGTGTYDDWAKDKLDLTKFQGFNITDNTGFTVKNNVKDSLKKDGTVTLTYKGGSTPAVPEPSTVSLTLLALTGLLLRRRRAN